MSELTTVARPYARAAFELAVENNNIKAWSEMLSFAAEVLTYVVPSKFMTSK